MRDLLPHFQRELQFLQTHRNEFAAAYPELGGRLATASDLLDDPHVERMVQSFALLAARVHKRLDDDFPLFTESLLEVLYPHYLRPFPSCAIAHFNVADASGQNTLVSPSITPRPKPVTIDPRIEPMPPITTTANTTMIRFDPISGPICVAGAASTPANPASPTPKP